MDRVLYPPPSPSPRPAAPRQRRSTPCHISSRDNIPIASIDVWLSPLPSPPSLSEVDTPASGVFFSRFGSPRSALLLGQSAATGTSARARRGQTLWGCGLRQEELTLSAGTTWTRGEGRRHNTLKPRKFCIRR